MNSNDTLIQLIESKLRSAHSTGMSYYNTRADLINKGYESKDIDTAVSKMSQDPDFLLWTNEIHDDIEKDQNIATTSFLLSGFGGLFANIINWRSGARIIANRSGRKRSWIWITFLLLCVIASLISIASSIGIIPIYRIFDLLPQQLALPLALAFMYGLPIVTALLVSRFLWRKK